MSNTKYWIAAISKEHALRAVSGGFIQVCHGRQAPLKRMHKGDQLLIYSAKITMDGNEKCQAFTAVGQVSGDDVYSFKMTADFTPFRRDINFFECKDVSILPLINDLEFILNKRSWGYPFRFGFFEINEHDFNYITAKMLKHECSRQYF